LCAVVTDRYFAGAAARVSVIAMALTGLSVLLFWKLPTHSLALSTVLALPDRIFPVWPAGYGGVVVMNFGHQAHRRPRRLASAACSYASTVLSGWGLGKLVETHGWAGRVRRHVDLVRCGHAAFALSWRGKSKWV